MDASTPTWLSLWCSRVLGSSLAELLFVESAMSEVYGVRLADGRSVVIKARFAEVQRVQSCLVVQRGVAASGFPCPAPLSDVTVHEGKAVHAEEYLPDGEVMRGDGPDVAATFAVILAELADLVDGIRVPPPLPNPIWLRWDHSEPGVWPAYPEYPGRLTDAVVPRHVEQTARRVRARLREVQLPCVVGHGDWESQNLRWQGERLYAVHDWDSMAWLPEAAVVGSACGAFASIEQPTLAPLDSSAAFLEAYESARSRRFTADEREVAWAASLWLPAHNAFNEAMYGMPPLATEALSAQVAQRLKLANA
jgi:Ser/Thr protein kinase RdoA (MazF antagonist)